MDTVVLASAILVLSFVVVLLLWIFRPALTSRQNAAKPKKTNTFSDCKGVIREDNQIKNVAKCDISLVVPAYNEVCIYPLYFCRSDVTHNWHDCIKGVATGADVGRDNGVHDLMVQEDSPHVWSKIHKYPDLVFFFALYMRIFCILSCACAIVG